MENWMGLLGDVALGFAFGAAAGGRGSPVAARAAMQGAANCGADHQRLLGAQAARLQNVYAQGAMGAYGAQANSNSTVTVNPLFPQWLWMREVRHESEKKVDEDFRSCVASNIPPSHDEGVHGYVPIQVEAHEDFAAKLAARPKEQRHGKEESV